MTERDLGLASLVTAVCGTSAALSGSDGDIRRGGAQGFYVRDTRVLDRLEVRVDGERPAPLSASLAGISGATFHAHIRRHDDPNGDPGVLLRRDRLVDGRPARKATGSTSTWTSPPAGARPRWRSR